MMGAERTCNICAASGQSRRSRTRPISGRVL